jgi:hypothetical protein
MKRIHGILIAVLVVALIAGALAFDHYRRGVEEEEARRDTCELMRDMEQAVMGYAEDEC